MSSICLSLSGSGHLLVYHLGVARRLAESALWARIGAFAGSSGGAVAAAALATNSVEAVTERGLGGLEACPADDRLFVCATECPSGRPVLFSRFADAEELRQCVRASCAFPASFHPLDLLPISSTTYAAHEGVEIPASCDSRVAGRTTHASTFVDGGFSAAAPLVPGYRVLTVSPLAGPPVRSPTRLHICPPGWSLFKVSLGGLDCYLSRQNAEAAAVAFCGGRVRSWYEAGAADASRFLEAYPDHEDPFSQVTTTTTTTGTTA